MNRTLMAVTLSVLAVGAAPARAQIPGIGDAARVLDRVPSLSSFLEGDPPITTSLDDARTEIAFLDGWSPAGWQRLDALPRTGAGAFRLRPGRFAMEAQSYCMHAGTHGPGGGDGYLYAPLEGPKADIVQSLLRNSVSHPEIPQRDIQVLIWAIIARTEFDEMPSEMQRTARALLTRDQVDDLDDGALGEVPESVMREAMSQLPPVAQQVFQAEARLRSMISSGTSNFAALERVAVLTGAVEPPEGSRPVPGGRWSFDPDGYFVRYDPSGYSRTRVEVSVPKPVAIARDASGRIVGIYGPYGRRLEMDGGGLRLVGPGGGTGEIVLNATPSTPGAGGGPAAAVLGVVLGPGRAPAGALRDLAEIEGLARAVRASGTAVGDGASAPGGAAAVRSARADALDLLMEAWQATFCQAALCPSTPAADDVLVLRSGGIVRGELRWCAVDTCALASTYFATDEIEWIGLARPDANPPTPQQPNAGEVHLESGAVQVGNLQSVGDHLVLTDAGGHQRPEVAWIHLVPGEDEEEDPPFGLAADNRPPPSVGDRPEGEDEDEQEDDGEFDGPVYDPSDDVATPGNRGRQRLAQSPRPSGESAPEGEEDACADERRQVDQAEALAELQTEELWRLQEEIREVTGEGILHWLENPGPWQNLVDQYVEEDREWEELMLRITEAWVRLAECEAAAG